MSSLVTGVVMPAAKYKKPDMAYGARSSRSLLGFLRPGCLLRLFLHFVGGLRFFEPLQTVAPEVADPFGKLQLGGAALVIDRGQLIDLGRRHIVHDVAHATGAAEDTAGLVFVCELHGSPYCSARCVR